MKIPQFFLSLLLVSSLEARTWTSSDGKPLEAEYISSTENEVSLKRDSDGKTFTLPLVRLSEEDQQFIKEQEAIVKEPAAVEGEYSHLIAGEWVLAEHKNLPYSFYGSKELDGSKKYPCLLYTSPSPRDQRGSRMPSSA